MDVHVSRGSLFRSEIFHMIDLCIVHSETGGGPLTKFTRSEDRLTTNNMHVARLSKMPLAVTTSLCSFLAYDIFASEKRSP